jgi:hypothetical protein
MMCKKALLQAAAAATRTTQHCKLEDLRFSLLTFDLYDIHHFAFSCTHLGDSNGNCLVPILEQVPLEANCTLACRNFGPF